MTRSDFIKLIIMLFGSGVLPSVSRKEYSKIYLLQSFVRGFRFYDGPSLMNKMQKGDMLELVRELKNEHDEFAIALHFNNKKIGYIPREDNVILSRLLDAEVLPLLAEITFLEENVATWEQVTIAVYVLKPTDEVPEAAAQLCVLETPEFITFKQGQNNVSRIAQSNVPIYDGDDFYEALVENSKDDSIYDIIHNGPFMNGKDMNDAVEKSLLLVNKENLPPDLRADKVVKALDEGIIELNNIFADDGYVVANIERVAELAPRLEKFVKIVDKSGRAFIEAVMK